MKNNKPTSREKIINTVLIALFAAVISVSALISIPSAVPFTLQTFGIFLALLILGGKRGSLSVLIYIFLGAVGLPVFSGFKGGIGTLFGATGGYIVGFIFICISYIVLTHFFGEKAIVQLISLIIGLIICYAFGTMWFMIVFADSENAAGLISTLTMCVFPFIIPDIIKLAAAFALAKAVKSRVKIK